MKVSVCITTFNEEKTINKLLDSLLKQTKTPDEIVIVDGGSTDNTVQKLKNSKTPKLKSNQKLKLKIFCKKGLNIAEGRNYAINKSRYHIIAMTDAGCILHKNWLKEILLPFQDSRMTSVVAGYYKMTGKSNFQIALKPFLGVMPDKFNPDKFLPSTRSIAFKKSVWKKVGGFNEKLDKAGEDTEFNLKISNFKFQITRRRGALVNWEVPDNLFSAIKKFFYYANGDAQIGGFTKHNIHTLTIILRYLILVYLRFLIPFYLVWVIWKHSKYTYNWQQRVYTVIIQLVSDFSVMAGYIWGTLNK